MKLKVTESIFSDGTPHIQIVEGITLSDLLIDQRTNNQGPEVAVTSEYSWHKRISISFKISARESLKKQLVKYEVGDGYRSTNLHEYVFNSPKYGPNPHPIVSADWSITPKYNGIRTKEAKIEKFESELNKFVSEFNQEEKMVGVLGDINERLGRAVDEYNKKYNEDVSGFFTKTGVYSEQWDSYFQENKDCQDSIDEVSKLEKELSDIKVKLQKARQNTADYKNKIVLKQLEKMGIEEELKSKIKEVLSDPNTKANKDSGVFDLY